MEEFDKSPEQTPEIYEAQNSTGMVKPAFYYGLLTAIGLILLTLIIYFADLLEAKWVSWVGYLILIAGVVIGTRAYRDEVRGGFINYGTALGFGTLSMFFAALIASVFTYLFYVFIAPDALAKMKILAEVRALEANPNLTDQELDMILRFISPTLMAITTVFSYTFFGFVISLITSAFLKKNDPLEA
jgi:hypothetical protein